MRTLVVVGEGERGYAYLLVRWLRQLGCDACCAESADDALALIDAGPTAALINLDLPSHAGIAIAAAIRAVRPDAPVAFYTRDETRVRPEARMPVVARPMSIDEVANALGRQRVEPATPVAT